MRPSSGFGSIAETLLRETGVISHWLGDELLALKIAQIASEEDWSYWVDVLDPQLKIANQLSSRVQAYAIALIIEMALLNCERLIAVWSPRTAGSQWVPYEYGRAKENHLASNQVACWHPGLQRRALPEYLLLGRIHADKKAIRAWLRP